MEIELFLDLDGKRLVQTVSHAFILSIFNILETFHFDSNNMFPFCFLLKNGVNLASSSSIRQQLFSKTIRNISYFKTLKNMLTCRSV